MPTARSTSRDRRTPREQSPPRQQRNQASDEAPTETLLVAWTAVFPLSHGPAHRVRLHTGPDADAELVAAIAADYVRELSERAPSGCRISADGDLFGPRSGECAPQDVLFAAVFTTDLDAIVARHSPPGPEPARS